MAKLTQNLKNHLFYNSHYYLIIALIVCLLIPYLINLKVAYKPNEELTIYIASYGTDEAMIKEMLLDNLDDSILNINVLSYDVADNYFETTLTSVAVTETDIVIIPEKYATETVIVPYFAKLNNLDLVAEERAYSFGDNWYGVEIYNKNKGEFKLSKMITFNSNESDFEKYYMFVNKDTVNLNSIIKTNQKYSSNYLYDAMSLILGWAYEEEN